MNYMCVHIYMYVHCTVVFRPLWENRIVKEFPSGKGQQKYVSLTLTTCDYHLRHNTSKLDSYHIASDAEHSELILRYESLPNGARRMHHHRHAWQY